MQIYIFTVIEKNQVFFFPPKEKSNLDYSLHN